MSYNKKFKAVTHTLKGIYISCSITRQSSKLQVLMVLQFLGLTLLVARCLM